MQIMTDTSQCVCLLSNDSNIHTTQTDRCQTWYEPMYHCKLTKYQKSISLSRCATVYQQLRKLSICKQTCGTMKAPLTSCLEKPQSWAIIITT